MKQEERQKMQGESVLSRRMWRWCIARTMRDLRESVRRGRPISRANLRRMFLRRWSDASIEAGMAEESDVRARREEGGCYVLDSLYVAELRAAVKRTATDHRLMVVNNSRPDGLGPGLVLPLQMG